MMLYVLEDAVIKTPVRLQPVLAICDVQVLRQFKPEIRKKFLTLFANTAHVSSHCFFLIPPRICEKQEVKGLIPFFHRPETFNG